MDYNTFVSEAQRTNSDMFLLGDMNPYLVEKTLRDFISAGQKLDQLKKYLFYGREVGVYKKHPSLHSGADHVDPDTVHGMIGISTEAVEIAEALLEYLQSGTLDEVNLKEELGDLDWYRTLLVKSQDELERTYDTIIAKLRARYPEKFTSENAITRDLNREREILEGESYFLVVRNYTTEDNFSYFTSAVFVNAGSIPMGDRNMLENCEEYCTDGDIPATYFDIDYEGDTLPSSKFEIIRTIYVTLEE